ncbi:hypothetical protein ACOSP7_018419 [Xanthoceras sorbifolium]
MQILAKIKLFVWWMFHGWLPVLEVLVRQKMIADASCPLCHYQSESILHAIWGCPDLKPVREASGVAKDISFKHLYSPADFLLSCFSQLKQAKFEFLLVVFLPKLVPSHQSCA